jgi:hypothetical protein
VRFPDKPVGSIFTSSKSKETYVGSGENGPVIFNAPIQEISGSSRELGITS